MAPCIRPTATLVISRHKRFLFKPVCVMTMKHLNLQAKNYKLLVSEENSVPGLCTDMTQGAVLAKCKQEFLRRVNMGIEHEFICSCHTQ